MAIITPVPTAWTAIGAPTAAAEIWQCTAGVVEISAETNPGVGNANLSDGIRLEAGQGYPISAGKTVKYRSLSLGAAVIRREAL